MTPAGARTQVNDKTNNPKSDGDADNPMLRETEAMHRLALEEIRARGENPEQILRAFDLMDARLREKHLPKPIPTNATPVGLEVGSPSPHWEIGDALYFEELVSAGSPTPGQANEGRRATRFDVMQGINTDGKIYVKISGSSMSGASIENGDIVLVDPNVDPRDGDLVLANLAGHGQMVKRLRLDKSGAATLESENPDFGPIKVAVPSDLHIHGKVLWRCGPVS